MMSEQEIINKEIRGVTAKTIVWFMSGIIALLITIMGTYFSIMRKIDSMAVLQTNMNQIEIKVDNNTLDIKDMKQHLLPSMDTRISIMEEQMKDKVFLKNAP